MAGNNDLVLCQQRYSEDLQACRLSLCTRTGTASLQIPSHRLALIGTDRGNTVFNFDKEYQDIHQKSIPIM